MSAPALATQPVPTMRTRGSTNRIMSWIVSPDSTWPPCEFTKMVMSSSDSAVSANSWDMTEAASFWLTSPVMTRVRAVKRRSVMNAWGSSDGVWL
jgi:hypothetical protein